MRLSVVETRIAEIEQLSRQRGLSEAELSEYDRLLNRRRIRKTRIGRQISACEAKLARLRAEEAVLA